MLVENFLHQELDTLDARRGRRGPEARIENGADVFVKFAGRWEWYRTDARGYRGMEKFLGFVDDAGQIRRLDRVAFGHKPGSLNWVRELIPLERCYRLVDADLYPVAPVRQTFDNRRVTL